MLRAVQTNLLDSLDLRTALSDEAQHWNNLLPPQPGLNELEAHAADSLVGWLQSELEAGFDARPQVVINARKPLHGIRPVPVLGIPERVVYRALVDTLLSGEPELRRDNEDYLKFVRAPFDQRTSDSENPAMSESGYVVKTDIASFYEYVDHGVLAHIVRSRSERAALLPALEDLLRDSVGQSYGLPQTFGASDRLSEVYGQQLEDQLSRRGHLVWRYNDDFRIAVDTYSDALNTIEDLAEQARALGLTLNERKTTTPKLQSYMISVLYQLALVESDDETAQPPDADPPAEAREKSEADRLAHYEEIERQNLQAARDLVAQLAAGDSAPEELRSPGQLGVGRFRGAVLTLSREKDPAALPAFVRLAEYVPSLTPQLCWYVKQLQEVEPEAVSRQLDAALVQIPLGGWQSLWFAHLVRIIGLSGGERSVRTQFLEKARKDSTHPVLQAEASLGLSKTGGLSTRELVDALLVEPSAVASWYVKGAVDARASDRDDKILRGLRGTNKLYAMLVDAFQGP